jgi:hypothetical protein
VLSTRGVTTSPLVVLTHIQQHCRRLELAGQVGDVRLCDQRSSRMRLILTCRPRARRRRRPATRGYPQFPQVYPQAVCGRGKG